MLKDLKLVAFAMLLLKLADLSLERNHKLHVVSEQLELYSIRLYIGMTRSKFSALFIVV